MTARTFPIVGTVSLLSAAISGLTSSPAAARSFTPQSAQFFDISTLQGSKPIPFTPFTRDELLPGTLADSLIPLGLFRWVSVQTYLNELNTQERELNAFGATLRNSSEDLGVIARGTLPSPAFSSQVPDAQQQSSSDISWSHEVVHSMASIRSSGRIVQSREFQPTSSDFSRTTTLSLDSRFLDTKSPDLARFVQRIVRTSTGEQQRDLQVYVNGRMIFRRAPSDAQEVRIWRTSFDVPLKTITIPVGPASVDAKIGIRGDVNIDLELSPLDTNKTLPNIALDFRPQVNADAYVSAVTTPTNIGEAGLDGAITLANDALNIKGTAEFNKKTFAHLQQLTVDNIFSGFNGSVVGFANVKLPNKSSGGTTTKRFEKEFYKWDGITVQKRLYEYKAPQPQPAPSQPQPPSI